MRKIIEKSKPRGKGSSFKGKRLRPLPTRKWSTKRNSKNAEKRNDGRHNGGQGGGVQNCGNSMLHLENEKRESKDRGTT